MNNPNVVLGVHRDANGRADDPMVRKRLWPQRIDFKLRRFDAGGSDGGPLLEDDRNDTERGEKSEKSGYRNKLVLHDFLHSPALLFARFTVIPTRPGFRTLVLAH